ncbi:crotonase/enoyl-CoA hydratase family protein [Streptomyces sp. SID4956]|uniref:crotonase/enoyl-CoA hydratase family protein n=1 Tax=Streptomyces sp. SID4956 TaxID=2690290 RepID=UPI00136EF7D5|nr:crotonase/enoyl-CoA hydratase family protein [Streptomyces sp. SID4956]
MTQTTDDGVGRGPLHGVTVVDTTDGRGETAGRFLADLGADVILVEPPGGAAARRRAPVHEGTSLYFATHNANKRGVTLDLETAGGRAALHKLLDTADIWIESERARGEGLDYPSVARRNPSIVLLTITDFGLTGPYRDHVATDAVHAALSGALCRSGLPGRPPLLPPGSLGVESASLQAAWVALLAHFSALTTGRGDHIDFSLHEAITQVIDPGFGIGGSATGGLRAADMPRDRPSAGYMYPIFPCADGLVRICVLSPRQWRGMRAWLGEPEEFADPRYEQLAVRFKEADRVHARIGELFRDRTRDELVADGQRHGVPIAGLLSAGEVLRADHYLERGALEDIEVAPGLVGRVPTGFLEIDGARAGLRRRAPLPGEHNEDILDALATAPQAPVTGDGETGDGETGRRRPLAGLRVLDFGVIVAGAELGRLLADQGADVIKIENKAFPDGGRQSRTGEVITASSSWGHRNKRSLGLNLRSPEGVELFKRLAADSDVVLSNFKPGTLESLGLGYETLREINPRIVMADSSALGSSGPWSKRMGYGPLVRASAGLSDLWRYPDTPGEGHSDAVTIYPDHVVGRVGATAVLAQLVRLHRTGAGGTVSISQAEIILNAMADRLLGEWLRPGSMTAGALSFDAPDGVFPCAGDDEWCTVSVRDDADWQRLCAAIDRQDLAADPALADAAGRIAHRDRIEPAVAEWTAARAPREVMDLLQKAGVPAAAMLRVGELLTDPQLTERGFFARLRQPTMREALPTEARPAHSLRLPDPPLRPAPLQAQHTRELGRELWGLSDEQVEKLIGEGVLETMSDRDQEELLKGTKSAVLVEDRGHVRVLTLNRPEARNAVNQELSLLLGTALEEADTDPAVRAVVVTGAGDKAFCAGADLKAVSRGENIIPPGREAWGFAGYVNHHIGKPVIAAVNGFALGGGTEIALVSDLVVASESAAFGLPEVRRGIIAAAGGAFRLAAQLPPKVAMELLLTGDTLSARDAKDLGLVNRVVPQDRVLEEAVALAERIAANAPLAVQASKRIARGIQDGVVAQEEDRWSLSHAEARAVMNSADAKEGPRAFAEKRAPVWQAR